MLKPTPSLKDVIALLEAITSFAHENLENASALVQDRNDDRGYYFGLLRRSATFSDDIRNILANSANGYYTSVYIIGRCVCDDLLTLLHTEVSGDVTSAINILTSDAYRQNFDKLDSLVSLNEKYYKGAFKYYPTVESMTAVREKFLSVPEHRPYLQNPDITSIQEMKLKRMKPMSELIKDLSEHPTDMIGRVYFFWRQWSDFVHFSPFAFNMEHDIIADRQSQYNNFQELAWFIFSIAKMAVRYFYKSHDLQPVDSQKLLIMLSK